MKPRRQLSKPLRQTPMRLALEPRIVFDGALPVAGADAANHPDAAGSPSAASEASAVSFDLARSAAAAPTRAPVSRAAPVDADADAPINRTPSRAAPGGAVEIAFVDAAVQDIRSLLPDFKGEVITLRADRDGTTQIAEALAERSGIAAIHILSHGEAGRLLLGTGVLDVRSMAGEHAGEMSAIRAALSAHGDILLYGCDVSAGAAGRAFIEQLALATGADVAASEDDTGATARGGDWVLEDQVGAIDAHGIDARAWDGLLALTSSGTWTVAGTGNATTATSTVGGVTSTVSFGNFSSATTTVSTFATTAAPGTLNNIAVFSPAVQNTASLGFAFNWDTTPEGGTTEASVDAGTGEITITFSRAVTNPIIHLDRLGGSDGARQNGMRFTLVNPGGLTLTRLAGTSHFAVDTTLNTVQTSQIDVAIGTGYTGESNTTANLGTAAGSVRVNGTVTSVKFVMSAAPNSNEGAGGDGIEFKVSYEPAPIAVNDIFTTPHDTPTTFNVRVNDSEPTNEAFDVTAINGTTITAGGAGVAVTGGTVTRLTNGDLTFTPTAGFVGAPTFTYTVTDSSGGMNTATVNGTVTNVAPVVDLNSGSTASAERVSNGGFTGGACRWWRFARRRFSPSTRAANPGCRMHRAWPASPKTRRTRCG